MASCSSLIRRRCCTITPINIFVAGFIGSPGMNFFDATAVQEDGNLWIDTGAFRVKTPDKYRESWGTAVGRRVVLGVRPEDIHDPEFAPPGIEPSPIEATVDVTELMGNEVYLYLKSGNLEYIARVDPRTSARVGKQIQPVMNAKNMHMFDAETERAIR